jgi:nicotinate-nucleotide adenylyltransferase
MTRLLAEEEPFLRVDDRELRRGGTSYTIETVEEILEELALEPGQLAFLIGSDSLEDLPGWYRARELLELAVFVTVVRDPADLQRAQRNLEEQLAAEPRTRLLQHVLRLPPVAVTATRIRESLRRGESPGEGLTEKVAAYVEAHGLYRGPDPDRDGDSVE